jgi:hypothetical protein
MFQFLPMAIGAGAGLLTNKDPLKGALSGAALGGLTGGLASLGGAAAGATGTGLQAGGAAMAGAPGMGAATGTGLLSGGGQGLGMAAGAGTQLSAAGTPAASGMSGIFNAKNLETAGNVADLAAQMGVFDDPQQAPAPQSAGIPSRQADFTGLLSAGRSNNAAGAQRLMQQQAIRKQGRL